MFYIGCASRRNASPLEFRTPPTRRIRSRSAVGAGVAALVVLLMGAAYLTTRIVSTPTPTPAPTPVPRITAAAGELRTHPEVRDEVRAVVASELESFLTDLYERAFLPPLPAPTPDPEAPSSPAPTPIPRPPTRELFTQDAGAALTGSQDAYRTRPREELFRGEVAFRGIAIIEGEAVTDALVDVTFEADGRIQIEPPDPDEGKLGRYHDMRFRQSGRLQLVRTPEGWRVSGFDVELRAEELIPPSPEPEAAVSRTIEARWGL